MSDWIIHKYIMHNDNSPILSWRINHRIHHKEIEGTIKNNDTSLIFSNKEIFIIATITVIPIIAIFIYFKINILYIILLILFHYIGIFVGICIHNYAHTKHHNCDKIFDCTKIPIPTFIYNIISDHHENHHKNPKKNFCVVFLGFDKLIGTNY
tara:strand:- start:135 stop:593 length:459 start_codon:yes stop_codon:yes gene_type:complete